jgi:hypothetical protein
MPAKRNKPEAAIQVIPASLASIVAMSAGPLTLPEVPPPPAGDSLHRQIIAHIVGQLLGAEDESPEVAARNRLRRYCMEGDPFPLIAYLWPHLIIRDPNEAKFFEGEIGNHTNPCLRLDRWQRQILAAFFDESVSEIAIKGCTKAGKGTSVSIGVCLWVYVYDRAKVILTSQRWEHARDVIFGEISHWWSKMTDQSVASLQSAGIVGPDRYVTIANPRTGEGFSGQHGPRTLFVFDEATSVPDGFFDDAQKQARKIVAIANPRTVAGRFHSMYPKDDPNSTKLVLTPSGKRLCLTIGGGECLNVREKRLERPVSPHGGVEIEGQVYPAGETIPPEHYQHVKTLVPNQIDYARFQAILQHPDKAHIQIFAHGHFPEEDSELQMILGSWLDRHEKAHPPEGPPEAFGLDVARSLDGDSSCLAAGNMRGCHQLHLRQWADTTKTIAWVIEIVIGHYGIDLRRGNHPITVDMDGLGAGVGDRLKELGCWVIEFRGSVSSKVDSSRFANMRTEGYAELASRLSPIGRYGDYGPWALPYDVMLREELTAHDKDYVNYDRLKFKVRHKDGDKVNPGIKQLLGRSPDRSDALVYLWNSLRILHDLDVIAQRYERDMLVYPKVAAPEKPPADGSVESKRREIEDAARKSGDLLSWAKARYAKGAG